VKRWKGERVNGTKVEMGKRSNGAKVEMTKVERVKR
jgi:hypothetical protein